MQAACTSLRILYIQAPSNLTKHKNIRTYTLVQENDIKNRNALPFLFLILFLLMSFIWFVCEGSGGLVNMSESMSKQKKTYITNLNGL